MSTIELNDADTSCKEETMIPWRNYLRGMTIYTRILLLVTAIFFSAVSAGGSVTYKTVLRLSDRKVITFGEMVREVEGADMVFVGEVHDNERHHRAQLDVIRALHKRRIPLAIGLEMFRAEDQDVLGRWVKGKMAKRVFMRSYYDNWNLPWSTSLRATAGRATFVNCRMWSAT